MAIGCNEIVDCILKNCENLVQGIKDRAYFINYDCVDKDLSTFDVDNPLLLTQLVPKTVSPACYAYCVDGYNFSNEHTVAMVKTLSRKFGITILSSGYLTTRLKLNSGLKMLKTAGSLSS